MSQQSKDNASVDQRAEESLSADVGRLARENILARTMLHSESDVGVGSDRRTNVFADD